jgi:twitching motility protein PilT
MRTVPVEGDLLRKVVPAVGQSPLFQGLSSDQLAQVVALATFCQIENDEPLMTQGAESDSFYLLLRGELSVCIAPDGAPDEPVEIGRLRPVDAVGEMGLLLEQPRSATVVACGQVLAVQFDSKAFSAMMQRVPGFGLGLCRALAARLATASRVIPVREHEAGDQEPAPDLVALLPVELLQRFRMLPLSMEGNVLTLGFVDDPSPTALRAVRQHLPGVEPRSERIGRAQFERAVRSQAGVQEWTRPSLEAAPAADPKRSPRLDALLRRMVAEGASDLHLCAKQKPRWRIDGEIHELVDGVPLLESEAFELLEPVMEARNREQFERDNDTDFAYALPGTARFRTNVFRDHGGVGAVLRQIPDKILGFEQLGLPPVVKTLCEHPKGLVLVTGPTGSGKSTTLASMIDSINRARRAHVITLEDPIEFVHASRAALVNQREIGPHTTSFARALRAALREDPDIVLVGEMRDLETVALALEIANTGHLVFGTLHTATAVSTVDRIINLFQAEQQPQVRATLADVLRGVIAQTLCRKIGGGRVAALEILVSNLAVANLIREGKNHQIASVMSTGRGAGNQMLNEELARLVLQKKIEFEEAMTKAADKADLAKRCGKEIAPAR